MVCDGEAGGVERVRVGEGLNSDRVGRYCDHGRVCGWIGRGMRFGERVCTGTEMWTDGNSGWGYGEEEGGRESVEVLCGE